MVSKGAFKGWPAEAIDFFEGLEADNTKAYWQDHKETYERAVRAPMEALIEDFADQYGPGKIYRPYRDVRFSKDKSPYKTNIAGHLGDVAYISLSAAGFGIGSGLYMPSTEQLERYRAAVAHDRTGPELEKLVATAHEKGIDVSGHEALKTAPKGYPKDHPRIDLLRQKGLITWREWPPGPWLGTAEAKARIVEFLRDTKPITEWLSANVR
jgi:uncharacterized protein (TIGR02453 family)